MEKGNKSQIDQKVALFKDHFSKRLHQSIGRNYESSTNRDYFRALAYTVRDRLIDCWVTTQEHYYRTNPKRVYYLSLEFLMGRTLGNALISMNLYDVAKEAMQSLNINLETIFDIEEDAGLGNGGLGRLAACFLDSMATLQLPAQGYGIRYEYGMFKQHIKNYKQKESPDNWLRYGNPWEIARGDDRFIVPFEGHTVSHYDMNGNLHVSWENTKKIVAIGYDVPVPGYRTNTVNTLRLWTATADRGFDLAHFNDGDYIGAVIEKTKSEIISKVLYPNDQNYKGKKLRLRQQYFMVYASLHDIIRRLLKSGNTIEDLPNKAVIHLNDTHPSIAIPELMRILMDDYQMNWNKAWDITTRTFAYTNHTVLPEALEQWDLSLMQENLPRHMDIIFEINQRFLNKVSQTFPGDVSKRRDMSIIGEEGAKRIRMANLAIIGSFSVNGVAQLHSNLIKDGLFKNFYTLMPNKFNNKTNGITPRRWMTLCNPKLDQWIDKYVNTDWRCDLSKLKDLEKVIDNKACLQEFSEIKQANKRDLAKYLKEHNKMEVNVDSIFDVHVKRIHEYKRQLLNILRVIAMYNQIRDGKLTLKTPVTSFFAGKAAPGYKQAKNIIYLINVVSEIVNNDPKINKQLQVFFIPDYRVSVAEKIIPAADVSQQISTAGMEASGTGNMKFALNGSVTIGTYDGANIEIAQAVKDDNIFIFGKKEDELRKIKEEGYNPSTYINESEDLALALHQIETGFFSPEDTYAFTDLVSSIRNYDPFFVCADFEEYMQSYSALLTAYEDKYGWKQKAVLNVARNGYFSSDRTIKEYAKDIWQIQPTSTNKR